MNVALYIRVSTQEQTEGYSIDMQKERLINFAKAKDWNVYDIYIDGGFSGSNTKRPALEKMIKNMENIDIVAVYKLDRLSRSQKDTLYLIEDVFLKNKVDFVSLTESFDTSTPFGRAMVGILSVFAQLERDTIKERTFSGRIERAKEGLHHGGKYTPIGYDYIDGQLVINDYEALQIKEVNQLYLDGYGSNKIIQIMNEKGYSHKYGEWKNCSAVYNALFNPVYIGEINFNGETYEGKHEPIISQDTHAKVLKVRTLKKNNSSNFTGKSLLTGFIFCGKCGARYFTKNQRGKRYYACYSVTKSVKRMVKDPNCNNENWDMAALEQVVYENIKKLSISKDFKSLKKNKSNESNIIQSEVSKIDEKLSNLMDLYSIGGIPLDILTKKITTLQDRKNKLESSIDKININPISPQVAIDISKNLISFWDGMNIGKKRNMLRSLIKKITLNDNTVEIEWVF